MLDNNLKQKFVKIMRERGTNPLRGKFPCVELFWTFKRKANNLGLRVNGIQNLFLYILKLRKLSAKSSF